MFTDVVLYCGFDGIELSELPHQSRVVPWNGVRCVVLCRSVLEKCLPLLRFLASTQCVKLVTTACGRRILEPIRMQ
jgi:hypothetical protein